MRHRLKDKKLGRSGAHREALVAGLVCNLILQRRICTTLAKAKVAASLAERLVTLAKVGSLAARRHVLSVIRREKEARMLFDDVAPRCQDRVGGYTRIAKLNRRMSDGAEMAILEWVSLPPVQKASKKKTTKEGKEKKEEKK